MSKMDLTDLSRNYFGGLSSSQANSYVSGDPVAFAVKVCGTFLAQGPENPDGSTNLYAPDGSLAAVIDADGNLFVRDGERVLIYSAKPEEEDQNAVKAENGSQKEACEQEVFGSYVLTEAVCLPEPAVPPPEKQACEADVFTVVDEPQCAPPEASISTRNHAINLFGNYEDLLERILGISTPDGQSTIYDPPIEEPEQPLVRKADPVIVAPEPEPKPKPSKTDKNGDGEASQAAKASSAPADEKNAEVGSQGYGESESLSEDYSGFEVTFEYGSTEEGSENYVPASSGAEQSASPQNLTGNLEPAFYADSSDSSAASGLLDSGKATFDVIPAQAGIEGVLSNSFSAGFIKGAADLDPDFHSSNSKGLLRGTTLSFSMMQAPQNFDSGADEVVVKTAVVRSDNVTKNDTASLGTLPIIGFDSLSDAGFSPLPSFSSARGALLGGSKDGNAGILSLGFAGAITEDCAASIAEATRGLGGMPHTMFSSGILSAIFTAASDAEHKLHTIADVSHEGHSHGDGGDEGRGGDRDQENQSDDERFAESGSEDTPAAVV